MSLVPVALAVWLLGGAGLVLLGWDPDLAPWRIVGAGVAIVAAVAAVTVGRSRSRPEGNVVALLATLAMVVLLPPPVVGLAAAGVVVAGAAVLAGYYSLQLSLRTHAVAGAVLQHGMMRIAGTVAAAALLAVAAVTGLRAAVGSASARLDASLDVGSGQLLVAASVLLMTVVTALSMLMVARTHGDVGQEGGEAGPEPGDGVADGDA